MRWYGMGWDIEVWCGLSHIMGWYGMVWYRFSMGWLVGWDETDIFGTVS